MKAHDAVVSGRISSSEGIHSEILPADEAVAALSSSQSCGWSGVGKRTGFWLRMLFVVLAWVPMSRAAEVWEVIVLHPPGQVSSAITGIEGDQQVGAVSSVGNVPDRAAIWSGTPESFIDLNPPGAIFSRLSSISGSRQGGSFGFNGLEAGLWSGTADSFVSLSPPQVPAAVSAIDDNQQVGFTNIGAEFRAALWTGTAASLVDLHPVGANESTASAVAGGRQFGYVLTGGGQFGAMWSGTPESFVDMNPPGANESRIDGADGDQQVGYARFGGEPRAGIWSGTPGSFVDVHPPGFESSVLDAVAGGRQAGFVVIDGSANAGIWAGTPESFVNLNDFLPPPYTRSNAACIWTDGRNILVGGSAFNPNTNASEAVMWKLVLPGVSVGVAKRRNRAIFTITNTGNVEDTFLLRKKKRFLSRKRSAQTRTPRSAFRVIYRLNGGRITKAMTSGRASTQLAAGASSQLEVRVRASRKLAFPRDFRIRLTALSQRDGSLSASAQTRLRLRLPLR